MRNEIPKLCVDHIGGVDFLVTDGTLDFDGGSLIVWKDNTRSHILAAYSPASYWVMSWDTDGSREEQEREVRAG